MTTTAPRRPRKRVAVSTTRLDLLISGELSVEDLDDDEIRRMQLKASDGSFRGRPPLWIPHTMALAFKQEFFRRFSRDMQERVPEAMRALDEMLSSRHLAPGDATRLRAVELVLERTFGKVTQNVDQHVVVDKGRSFADVTADVVMDLDMDEIEGTVEDDD